MAAMHVMAAVRFLEKMQPKLTVQPCGSLHCQKHRSSKASQKVEVQLAYAIGGTARFDQHQHFGTGTVSNERLIQAVRENFDLRPAGIIEMLDLRRPIYRQTAAYGHFGRTDIDLPWERTDKVAALWQV